MKASVKVGFTVMVCGFLIDCMAMAYAANHPAVTILAEGEVKGFDETLSLVIRNVDNDAVAGNLTFPSAKGAATCRQYLELHFQSNALGAAVILSTNNRMMSADGRTTLANPAFKSGPDGRLNTADDEAFEPQKGASGAGLVGTAQGGHGYVIPLFWTVFDQPVVNGGAKGYTFAANYAREAAVTDKAQTHVFINARGDLAPQPFDDARSIAYASVVVGMSFENGQSKGLIASFPEDADGSARDGNGDGDFQNDGLRSVTSPVVIYVGTDYTGAPLQGYATNTLKLELIHQ